ncbi:hypothetical protein OUZ56_011909 [Daphnia magna]|uniref:Uncharacterized protein n=1 Tax=Daphnia magna TaxID=35525 RepID=A0ABQ9Z1H6_9CRUS|nr:hypothetical protein OUZ56_011909 [Daphnia magna]
MICTPSSLSPFEIPTTLGASYLQPCRRTHPIGLLFVLIVALNTRHSDKTPRSFNPIFRRIGFPLIICKGLPILFHNPQLSSLVRSLAVSYKWVIQALKRQECRYFEPESRLEFSLSSKVDNIHRFLLQSVLLSSWCLK